MLSNSYVRAWLAEAAACLAAALALVGVAHADQQQDPELKAVVQHAIGEAECFTDHYDSAVWYTLMEPRLRKIVKEKDERLEILKQVYCETHRSGQARLPPGLVMGVIEVESRFERYAISSAGAQGFMQIMPFWLKEIGGKGDNLFKMRTNLRMGCTILRFYLDKEKGKLVPALQRYNGSYGKPDYPYLVLEALNKKWYRS